MVANGMNGMQQNMSPNYQQVQNGTYNYPTQVNMSGTNIQTGTGMPFDANMNKAIYNRLNKTVKTNGSVLPNHYVPLVKQGNQVLSVEIFKGKSVVELETKWLELSEKLSWINEYTPFYSVETSGVDELGQQRYFGGELYRLRIGPFKQIEVANEICQKLSLKNVPCNVVRTE